MDFSEKVQIKLGASLVLCEKNISTDDNLEKVSLEYELPHGGPKPLIITADLSNECEKKNFLDKTIEHFGKLDIQINNAGVLESIEITTMEQFDRIMNINVHYGYLTYLAVKYLIKTQGNIVNVSSVNGVRSFPGFLAYCILKAAVYQLYR